jgi:hypothetical protein
VTIMVGMARSSSTRRLIAGVTAVALAAVLGTSIASSEVVLRNVAGGPSYYSQYANSLSPCIADAWSSAVVCGWTGGRVQSSGGGP